MDFSNCDSLWDVEREMKIFLDFLLFAIIIGVVVYLAGFHGRQSQVYACSEVTKDDPVDVQKMCKK